MRSGVTCDFKPWSQVLPREKVSVEHLDAA